MYPLLIMKRDKKGQQSNKLYLEAGWWKKSLGAGWMLHYHKKQTNYATSQKKAIWAIF